MIDADLMEAILDAPNNDVPRLELAARLEQRGDPRGAFIRIQCARAKLPPNDSQRAELEAEERAILAAHEKVWLDGIPCSHGVRFRRGFLASHYLSAGGWTDGGYEHVSFVESIDDYLRIADKLLDVAVFEYVAMGSITDTPSSVDTRPMIGERDWRRLVEHRIVERWTTFDCLRSDIDIAKFVALIASPRLSRLDTLKVQAPVGLAGFEAIARTSRMRSLRNLYWWNPTPADELACVLASSPYLALKMFGFGTPIGDRGLDALVGARALREVEVFTLELAEDASPERVAGCLASIDDRLRRLVISGAPFGIDECMARLARGHTVRGLRDLEIDIPLSDDGLADLIPAVGDELECLYINAAQLTTRGYELLLSSTLPRTLNLSLSDFPDDDEALYERFRERFMNF